MCAYCVDLFMCALDFYIIIIYYYFCAGTFFTYVRQVSCDIDRLSWTHMLVVFLVSTM